MNPTTLGRRLRESRERAGLSQLAASEKLGIPRTAISQIETGKRSTTTVEISSLAKLYGMQLTELLDSTETEEDRDILIALYRAEPELKRSRAAKNALDNSIDLFKIGIELEKKLGSTVRIGPPGYDLGVPQTTVQAIEQGERVALEERRRLGIGMAPIADVSELISSQEIWVSALTLPAGMSGLYLRHNTIGSAILVNADHARARKRFSYAHEYAHALLDRQNAISISNSKNATELMEKRANAFAAAFIMPRTGVADFLVGLDKGSPSRFEQSVFDVANNTSFDSEHRQSARSQKITFKDIALLAKHYGASYLAAVYRCKSLRHVHSEEAEKLIQKEPLAREYLFVLNMVDDIDGKEKKSYWDRDLRSEVLRLALEAFRQEVIPHETLIDVANKLHIKQAQIEHLSSNNAT